MKKKETYTQDEAPRIIEALMDESLEGSLRRKMQRWLFDGRDIQRKQEAFVAYASRMEPYWGDLQGDALARYNKLAARLGLEPVCADAPVARRARTLWRAVAAVLLPLVAVAGAWFWTTGPEALPELRIAEAGVARLPDSSRVEVAAGSAVHYRETAAQREVGLQGEAFFKVQRNAAKPFLVQTANLRVEVLGTHFSVSEFPDGTPGTVSLYEGSVRVETNGHRHTLGAGERLTHDPSVHRTTIARIPTYEMIEKGYKPRLKFDDTPFREVIDALAAYHGVPIEIDTDANLPAGRITIFLENETLLQSLELLVKLSREPLSYRTENGKIILAKK